MTRPPRGIRLHPDIPATSGSGLTDRPRLTFEAVSAAARGRWYDILPALGIPREYLTGKHGPCPAPGCPAKNDGFRYDARDEKRRWYCNGQGNDSFGDEFALLCHVHGWTPTEVLHHVADQLGLTDPGATHDRRDRGTVPPTPAEPRADDEQASERRRCAAMAARLISASGPAGADHPHLLRKGVAPVETLREIPCGRAAEIMGYRPQSDGTPLAGRLLLAPVTRDGQISTVELIDETGRKTVLKGRGTKAGGYWTTAPLPETDIPGRVLLLGEGVATVLTGATATDHTGVAALASTNLRAVARTLRARYPLGRLAILADLVRSTGLPDPHAQEAAAEVGAALAVPDFGTERQAGQTDFNDLAAAAGIERVRAAIQPALDSLSPGPSPAAPLLTPVPGAGNDHNQGEEPAMRGRVTRGIDDTRVYVTQSTPSIPSEQELIPSQPLRNPFGSEAVSATCPIQRDCLLKQDGRRDTTRRIESDAAEIVAAALRKQIAYDAESASWYLWDRTHWAPQPIPAAAEKLLADAVHIGTGDLGFRLGYLTGITQIATRRGLLPLPPWPRNVVPFANGLLDLANNELRPASPIYALDWCLPHAWDPAAECPTIRAWLAEAVEQDHETVELLRAWLAALVRGIALHRLLFLVGAGGSGKSTFARLAAALVGEGNTTTSDLRRLEENRFELANVYGKRLLSIGEAGRYGGEIATLKKLTGGDALPLERKHVQQAGTFRFAGLVLIVSNEDIVTTDSTSGLERRRVTVRFPHVVSAADQADWTARGGEDAILHPEIPGLIRWLLALPVAEITERLTALPGRVITDNLLGMAAGNSVAAWMMEACIPGASTGQSEDPFCVRVGARQDDRASGVIVQEHRADRLYPHYLTWAESENRKPVSLVRFGTILADIAGKLGHPITRALHPVHRGSCVYGLRLRLPTETPYDWAGSLIRRGNPFDSEGVAKGLDPCKQLIRKNPKESKGFDEFLPQTTRDAPHTDAEVYL